MGPHADVPLVAHIIYALGTGGLENGLVNLINRTPPNRYRHAIVCLTESSDFVGRITSPDIPVIALHKRPGHDLGLYWRVWKTLWKLKPDIIHTRNLATLEMQAVAMCVPGVKRVHGEHGRDVFDLDGSNWKYNLLRKALRPVIHRYIAVSKDLQGWLIETIGVPRYKVQQIYNGVDQLRFRPRTGPRPNLAPEGFLRPDSIVVGTVGRLAQVKNQLSLLHATRKLLERHSELSGRLRLVIVGDGPMGAAIRQSVEDFRLSQQVWLAGDRHDIPELLQLMDLFVLPSLGEGISNTVLEAMATGLPVIATKVGGNPELIEDGWNGALVPVNDDDALAAAMAELCVQTDRMRQLGGNGLGKVSMAHNWARTVNDYLSLYDQLFAIERQR